MPTIKVKFEVSTEQINDLMVAALEGGINYWCSKAEIAYIPKKSKENIVYASDVIGFDGTLILYDAESQDKWKLTQKNFLQGLVMEIERSGLTFDELYENHDATTADTIIQFALFGEIIFG
jgi:hypothetical protein